MESSGNVLIGGVEMQGDEDSVLGDVVRVPDDVWRRAIDRVADDSAEADMSLIPDVRDDVDDLEFDVDDPDIDEDPGSLDEAGDDTDVDDTDSDAEDEDEVGAWDD